ncbi:FAD-dependent oxidoreductase [Adlercreutzia equolifaciens]|uniref:FAD-dependent oxidoreductase n=1 Tax=Adlercreutzia equolifaciens TaxID=446660 RepID=UPI003AB88B1D
MLRYQLSRRDFIRTATVAGITVGVFGLSGCAPLPGTGTGRGSGFTPGTYQAEGDGKFAPITVEVTMSETGIVDARVVSHEETEYISDRAIAEIPEKIVEFQSLDIDAVTGATLTSMAILSAARECVSQAGSAGALASTYERPVPSDEVIELEADVVIAGAGASGMAAAIACAQRGASVIIVEKSCNIGGNGLVCGGYLEYPELPKELRPAMTDVQRDEVNELIAAAEVSQIPANYLDELKNQWEAWQKSGERACFDSTILESISYGLPDCADFDASHVITVREKEFGDWLVESGFEFKEAVGIVGYPWPRWAVPAKGRCGQSYFQLFDQEIQKGCDVEVMLNTPATSLLTEGNVVIGLEAMGEDGTTYRIRGNAGTVLATGGFSGNPEMLRRYNEIWPWEDGQVIPTTNCYGHDGDGITMGLAVGCGLSLMHLQMPFPFADCKNGTDETTVGDDVDCVIVNKHGERFMNEILDRYTMTENIMAQPDQMMFMISDARTSRVQGDKNRYGRDLQNLIDQGQLYVSDTIEGLASAIGCDPAVLCATIEHYNEIARSGNDTDFGRTTFSEESPIEQPPFYASPRTWAMHITTGGITTDVVGGYRALREDGSVIEGLRVLGECASGMAGVAVMSQGLAMAKDMFGA